MQMRQDQQGQAAGLGLRQVQEGEKSHFYISVLAKFLGKLVSNKEVTEHCEKKMAKEALKMT